MMKNLFITSLFLASLSLISCSSTRTAVKNDDTQKTEVENAGTHAPPLQTTNPSQAKAGSDKPSTGASVSDTKTSPEVVKAEKDSKIKWLTLEEAYKLNQTEPRKIFVDVYTDWCGWCKKMDKETFANAEVAAYVNEHFYAVKLNAESTREFEMAGEKMTERVVARQLGVSSYPTIVFIHEDFQKFQPVPGYRGAKDFKEVLAKFKAIDINLKQ